MDSGVAQRYMPIIPAIWESETGRQQVQDQHGQFTEIPSQSKIFLKKTGYIAQW